PVMGAGGQNGTHGVSKASGPGVIVGRSGSSYGQVYLSEGDFWPHNTSMFVTDFKGNDEYFTYYLLKNLDFDRLNSGSAQPSLNRNFIYPVKVRVPKPNEQTKISAVLRAIDQKIELNNRINTELEAMAKTLYDYWFVQFDFPDVNGKPYKASGGKMVYNDALKREIPEGWSDKTLS
ncbi:restriction endonuclease subunit S, partial [Vibrio parahaemolyticus]